VKAHGISAGGGTRVGGGVGAGPQKQDKKKATVWFFRPDGREIGEVPKPPTLPSDPVGGLVHGNAARGEAPDEWTATPLWHGEPMDYSLAIDMLREV